MTERTQAVTMKGNPLTLIGPEIAVGQEAPDFTLVDTALGEVTRDAYYGKVLLIAAVPSLDTPVCDMEIRRFNQEAVALGDNVHVLFVSMDLPFAQKRFCAAAGIDRVITLSDHRSGEFGEAYGVLIEGLRLLARAIFIVDEQNTVHYVQYVGEVTDEPDYRSVLDALAEVIERGVERG